MTQFKKIFLILLFAVAVFVPGFTDAIDINGVEYNNIRGWAWSDNIGWVSFSCHSSEGTAGACANPWGTHMVMPSESGNIGIPDRSIIGHAWSDTLGWISFQKSETGEPPLSGNAAFDAKITGQNYTARFDADQNTIIGWARVLSACTSIPCVNLVDPAWNGWIQFLDATYGVKISNTGRISGYAWGGDVIGWLTFDVADANMQAYMGIPVDLLTSAVSPLASISLNQSLVAVDPEGFALQVNANGSASGAGGAGYTITSYSWNWGDGTTSAGITASHTYTQEGSYTITLTVTNSEGASNSVSQNITFTSPSVNACMFSCQDTTECNYIEGNICFIPEGETTGYCIVGPQQTLPLEVPIEPAILQSPTAYDCVVSQRRTDVLEKCSQVLEECPASGTCLFNGVSCVPGVTECPSSAPADYSCGVSVSGPFCLSNRGVYSCLYGPGTLLGRAGGYTSTAYLPTPAMPLGVQAEGQACTKPTADAPNNCEGINGCLYYNYEANGLPKDVNGDGRLDGVVSCLSESIETLAPATGCIYYYNGGLTNTSSPTLVNCLPSDSFAGLPEGCIVTQTAQGPIVDCSVKTEANNGGGCVFQSNGIINCTFEGSRGKPYEGCIYEPNPKGAINCPGIITESQIETQDFVQCSLSGQSIASISDPVQACYDDGTCPNPNQTCINGSCYSKCDPAVGEVCAIGQECLSPCPEGQYWDFATNQCVDSAWLALPDCQNAYLKDSATGEALIVYQNLPVGVTRVIMGLATTENVNCKSSTNPLDTFNSPTMDLFSILTGGLIHETLATGLFPLPDINRYLIRCQNIDTGAETPACKISIQVGKACSSNADCDQGQFCNPETNYCEIPTCLGAAPSPSTVFNAGTESTAIGMNTTRASLCKYDTDISRVYADMSGNLTPSSDSLSHSGGVSGLVGGYNAYYVQCQDLVANAQTGEREISNTCRISFRVGGEGNACQTRDDCLLGQICDTNTNTCQCPFGTQFDTNTGQCVPVVCALDVDCEGNLQCDLAVNECRCPFGTTPDPVTSECVACVTGEICDQCPFGTTYNPITNLCEPGNACQIGTVWDPGSQSCIPVEPPNICNVMGIEFNGVAPGTGIGPARNCSIVAVILALVNWFAWLVAVLTVVYGLRGGYLYITSAGNEKRLEEAKKSIIYTMVGVVVAVMSFSIIAITRAITGL